VSPGPVLNETRQCSSVATRQSTDVDIVKKRVNGKRNGLVHCKAYVLLCVANGPCKCKCKEKGKGERKKASIS